MNPTDLSNALLYGIPVVLYAGMYGGFDSILTRRECWPQPEPGVRSGEERRLAAARGDHAPLHISFGNAMRRGATNSKIPRMHARNRDPSARRKRLPSLSHRARRRSERPLWVWTVRTGYAPRKRIAMSSSGIASRVAEYASSRALRWRSALTRKPCSLRFFI